MKCERSGCSTEFDRDDANEPVPSLGLAGDDEPHAIMCDDCTLATLILAYSREEHPYVDIGLYSEVVFYARQLAAASLDDDALDTLGFESVTDVVQEPTATDDTTENDD